MSVPHAPEYLWELFVELRWRQYSLTLADYDALQRALRAGFGWASPDKLRALCCALWAKSRAERNTVGNLFDAHLERYLRLHVTQGWTLPTPGTAAADSPEDAVGAIIKEGGQAEQPTRPVAPDAAVPAGVASAPAAEEEDVTLPPRSFVLASHHPINRRQLVQIWRRLRNPVRVGPATELDVQGTIALRQRLGATYPIVLRPARRNAARIVVLVDRKGSMDPFHGYTDEVCQAIRQVNEPGRACCYYYTRVPAERANRGVLRGVVGGVFAVLDPVLAAIKPAREGSLYCDPSFCGVVRLSHVLRDLDPTVCVVVISDCGAARGAFDIYRLVDTLAFVKGLYGRTRRLVWLNPLPRASWQYSTAEQVARHVPMMCMADRADLQRAVAVLRGQPISLERPL